jgi:hypothetical protein
MSTLSLTVKFDILSIEVYRMTIELSHFLVCQDIIPTMWYQQYRAAELGLLQL